MPDARIDSLTIPESSLLRADALIEWGKLCRRI
jgi:hypothetical protein